MSALSNYLENKLAAYIFNGTAYSSPYPSIYVALHTQDPTDAATGSEVSGNNYSRVQVTAWQTPSNGATENTNVITFPTASGSWGTITHVGIWDASTGGNLLFHGQLTESKTIGTNDVFTFPAGQLDVIFS